MTPPAGGQSKLSVETLRWIDVQCDAFESALEEGQRLPIQDFLNRAPSHARAALLQELLCIEMEFLPTKPPEEVRRSWLERFPEDQSAVVRIYEELHGDKASSISGHSWNGAPPRISGYEILRKLGEGGMGVVYLARREAFGDEVALKLIHPITADWNKRLELFRREAEILRTLEHPRIVRFLEAGAIGDAWYLTMEYVPAVNLPELLGSLPEASRIRTLCGIIFQILDGLAYAHDRSFVHRDIKPSNILVVRNGRILEAKLADFGLAKNYRLAGISGITHLRDFRGTLAYIAPEQLLNSRDAQPAADIYSVGATLYRLLSGEHPFAAGTDIECHEAVLEGRIPPLYTVCPAVPKGLSQLVSRAMARSPSSRFSSARAMRQEILPYAQGRY